MLAEMSAGETSRGEKRTQGRTFVQQGIVEFAPSLYQHLTLPSIAALSMVAERHGEALRHFPLGSKLKLSAEGDRGSAWENGYLNVYAELLYPSGRGQRSSGQECIYRNGSGTVAAALEAYLERLTGPADTLSPPAHPADPAAKITMSRRLLNDLSSEQLDAVVAVVTAAEGRLANLPDQTHLKLTIKGRGEVLYSMGEGEYVPARVVLEMSYPSGSGRKSVKHEIAPDTAKPAELAAALSKKIDMFSAMAARGL